jgi:hypothetical protein
VSAAVGSFELKKSAIPAHLKVCGGFESASSTDLGNQTETGECCRHYSPVSAFKLGFEPL